MSAADPFASTYGDELRVQQGAAWLRGLSEAIRRSYGAEDKDALILSAAANIAVQRAWMLRERAS